MSCFVQLSEDDAGVECKRWLRSVNKDTGKVQEMKREEPAADEPEEEEEEEEEVKPAKKGAAAKKGGEAKKEVKEKKKVEVKEEVKEAPLTAAQKLELLDRQFVPLIDKIVAANTELEVEVGFTLALHVLGELTDSKQQLALIGKVVSTLAARPTEQTAVRMQWLTRLFNSPLLDAGAGLAVRSSIYSSLLRVALAAGAARELSGSYGDVEAWVVEWKLTKAQIAELYLLISQLAAQAEDTAESGLFTLRYLKTVSSGELPLAPAKPVAIAAVLSLLSSPDMPPYDELLNLSAVSQLRDDAKNAHIYKLLHIFAQDSIDSYTSLAAEKKDLLVGTGLTHDDVMRKLRTLTICSLGASSDRVTYAELQKKLGLAAPSDVEAVVIDAVLSGRVEAKLDQEKQIVSIQRCAPRSFTSASWRDLSAKLSLWQRNVHTVLQTLHDVQSNGGPSVDSH